MYILFRRNNNWDNISYSFNSIVINYNLSHIKIFTLIIIYNFLYFHVLRIN